MQFCGLLYGRSSANVLGVSFIPWLGWTSPGGINSTAVMFTEMFPSLLLFLSSLRKKKCKKSSSDVCGGVLLPPQQESSSEGHIRALWCALGDVDVSISAALRGGEVTLSSWALTPLLVPLCPLSALAWHSQVPGHSSLCHVPPKDVPPFFSASHPARRLHSTPTFQNKVKTWQNHRLKVKNGKATRRDWERQPWCDGAEVVRGRGGSQGWSFWLGL